MNSLQYSLSLPVRIYFIWPQLLTSQADSKQATNTKKFDTISFDPPCRVIDWMITVVFIKSEALQYNTYKG